ncbi:hypothetical protein PUNSTDRAFT_46071 [Punctularia strigosozonata HHB-11173 SS5]|uniref:uncharacterized protein n=1 Tax=Punctularia strigosozonata (strain HHB-11173) TaxID=741275 RepID=UPI0004417886|nr:uncharacterized protein PUNSTDRAFT_46071 [Punctularia strigosozonata HHB-11173 SS5]EIN06624.1 hypothetical protein PUNSTDRAFT_46071 [Punctularia strigosozonata HHB-11173 SS5]
MLIASERSISPTFSESSIIPMASISTNLSEADSISVSNVAPLSHDSQWYIKEDNVEIQAGSTLFRVPSYSFHRGSDVFRTLMNERPKDAAGSVSPVKLPDFITAEDLRRFLEILYPIVFGIYPLRSAEEWISVLHVANYFDFESIKALAMQQLDGVASAVDKIICAKAYGVDAWLEAAYADICVSSEPPTLDEAERLGLQTYAQIMTAREKARGPVRCILRPEVDRIIRTVFGLSTPSDSGDAPPGERPVSRAMTFTPEGVESPANESVALPVSPRATTPTPVPDPEPFWGEEAAIAPPPAQAAADSKGGDVNVLAYLNLYQSSSERTERVESSDDVGRWRNVATPNPAWDDRSVVVNPSRSSTRRTSGDAMPKWR